MKRTIMAQCLFIAAFLCTGALPQSVPVCRAGNVVLETDFFRYEIGEDGKNLSFLDKTGGLDYCDAKENSSCASIVQDGRRHSATSARLADGVLHLGFGESGVAAHIRVEAGKDRVVLEVDRVTGRAESLTFINCPLTLEGMPYEPFAACVLSMNLRTHVKEIPALHTHLWAAGYERFGLAGSKVTLVGVPQGEILPLIRDVVANAEDIPPSRAGGAWAQLRESGYGSYLMNFGTLTEDTVDEWIAMCRSLGFNQIDNHGGGAFFKFGDFELNAEKWPDGWESFRRINKRLHDAGIESIFHTYAFFIDKNSKYATPVPHEDLGYFRSFTLAEPLDPGDDEIVVKESTANVSLTTGFFVRNSLTLRIGKELIEFSGVTDHPPYKFTGCKRGANGTERGAFPVNEKAYHLREMFGKFVPGPETALFDEIARRTAEIVNECDFDGVYFDAIDGSDILGGAENFWYYGTKFVFEVVRQMDPAVGMEMSSMSHHWWHYRSRWQAWDRPVRGYKRFIDIHAAAIKADEYDHGLWRGHGALIDKFAAAENGRLLLPLHFGWWGNQTWNPPQVEPTFPDVIEYLGCKMIGHNAGLSMLGGVDKKTLDENPLFAKITGIIRQYEDLRHKNYFSEDVRRLLRQAGKEFTLVREADGGWNFRPVAYQAHKVAGLDHPSAAWRVNNEFAAQPVKLRIEPLMSVKPYNDPANVVLADFSANERFSIEGAAGGVAGTMDRSTDKVVSGGASGVFAARSEGTAPREGSWLKTEKAFTPLLDLSNHQALGVWVNGDGNGELLNFRVESPRHLSHGARGDHFITIDFTGWKYFELVEIESSEASEYIWPDSGFYVYDSYRHTIPFKSVEKLQVWYNNLPAGRDVECLISPVKALPLVPVTIKNPSVTVGDDTIVFPVEMESGMYLEFRSGSDCTLFGPKGEELRKLSINGGIPTLAAGENDVSFSCEGPDGVSARVQVTIIGEGEPLPKK